MNSSCSNIEIDKNGLDTRFIIIIIIIIIIITH